MGDSVRAVLRANPMIRPGDVYALNDPYHGGTHLPDITVVTPMFDAAGQTLLFWVASRGHHADVGGITPGSMPPHSRHIGEEGVLLDNFRLVSAGVCMRRNCWRSSPPARIRRAIRRRIWPTSRPRSPPTSRA